MKTEKTMNFRVEYPTENGKTWQEYIAAATIQEAHEKAQYLMPKDHTIIGYRIQADHAETVIIS